MEDTLRYYFSALFQGFAAIITLGAMYFLYFFDKNKTQKMDIIEKLEAYRISDYEDFILQNGIVEFVKQKILPFSHDSPKYEIPRYLVHRFDTLIDKESRIKNYLPVLLKNTIAILIISLVCLFIVGYNIYIDYVLVLLGLITIFLSIKILFFIQKVILEIMEIKK